MSPGSNNLDICGTNYFIEPITISTSWGVFNNGSGFIDYELEQIFAKSCSFSYVCIRTCGPVVEYTYGIVDFRESPSLNLETFIYDKYKYLTPSGISKKRANELVNHFTCKIKEYQQANYPGWIVSEVDFYGDTLLCSNDFGVDHYLKARFRMSRHLCGNR